MVGSGRDGIRLTDTTGTTVERNVVEDSGRWGIAVDGESANNRILRNRVGGSVAFHLFDDTAGGATAGTANLDLGNRFGTSSPRGLR